MLSSSEPPSSQWRGHRDPDTQFDGAMPCVQGRVGPNAFGPSDDELACAIARTLSSSEAFQAVDRGFYWHTHGSSRGSRPSRSTCSAMVAVSTHKSECPPRHRSSLCSPQFPASPQPQLASPGRAVDGGFWRSTAVTPLSGRRISTATVSILQMVPRTVSRRTGHTHCPLGQGRCSL